MKNKNISKVKQKIIVEDYRMKYKDQVIDDYWKLREKECELNLSKFC